jgi:hypothetical protein
MPVTGEGDSERGMAVGAGGSGSWLGPPILRVQAVNMNNPTKVKNNFIEKCT